MAYAEPIQVVSRQAEAAVSEAFTFVKRGTTLNQVATATAGSDEPFGVCQAEALINQSIPVMTDGVTKLVAGGTFSKGARLKPTTGGRAVTATVGTDKVHAIAEEACTVIGQVITARLTRQTV